MKLTKIIALNYIRWKFRVLSLVSPRKSAVVAFQLFCTPLEKSKKQTPPVFKFAEPVYELFNGKKLKGYRWNKGQPVKILILHGFASAAHKFHRYVLPLIEKGYEVIAFDAPGHGSSDSGLPRPFSGSGRGHFVDRHRPEGARRTTVSRWKVSGNMSKARKVSTR